MQRISYFLKNSYRRVIQYIFKLIYGTINSDQNKISKKNLFIKEVSNLKKKKIQIIKFVELLMAELIQILLKI